MKISKINGTIDFTGGTIHAALNRRSFLQTELGKTASVSMQNAGWTQYDIRPEQGVAATLLYEGEELHRVFIAMELPSDAPDNWSEELELERKHMHDDWLRREVGEPPIDCDWGRIVSAYDDRSCASDITVFYSRPEKS